VKRAEEEAELVRLLAEEASPLSPFVEGLRARGPDAAELASLASRLSLQGIDVTPRAASSAAAPWKKWLWPGAGGIAIALGWLALRGPADLQPTTTPNGSPVQMRERAADAPRVARESKPAGERQQQQPVSAAPATTQPSPSRAAEAPAPVAVNAPGAELEAPLGSGRARGTTSSSETERPAVASSATRSTAAASPAAPAPAPVTAETSAPSELALLRDARFALRQSPARALELAEQHARSYPQGKLTQERELLAISALVALGRRTAALSRGARFEQSFPSSAYRAQVAELLR
jgi:hypothetical protein